MDSVSYLTAFLKVTFVLTRLSFCSYKHGRFDKPPLLTEARGVVEVPEILSTSSDVLINHSLEKKRKNPDFEAFGICRLPFPIQAISKYQP